MPTKQATNGPVKLADPTAPRAKQVAKATEINKRKPGGAISASAMQPKTATVTAVPAAPALHATEKAPHTKQAVKESKAGDRLATANDRLTAAKAQLASTTKIANASKRNDPQRNAKFLAKTKAEMELLAARKAVAALDPTAKPAPKAAKTAPTPRASTKADQKITILAKENPYREGTKAFATFELFKRAKTTAVAIAEAVKAGGSGSAGKYDIGYLRYSSRDGYIKLG